MGRTRPHHPPVTQRPHTTPKRRRAVPAPRTNERYLSARLKLLPGTIPPPAVAGAAGRAAAAPPSPPRPSRLLGSNSQPGLTPEDGGIAGRHVARVRGGGRGWVRWAMGIGQLPNHISDEGRFAFRQMRYEGFGDETSGDEECSWA